MGYSVAVSGEGNHVTIAHETPSHATRSGDDTYIVAIQSDTGIGQASATWWGNTSPHHLYFHLHLSGLELFRLRWNDQSIAVSVNSLDQTVAQTVQVADARERMLAAGSPDWMGVTLPTPTLSIYALEAPASFIAAAPQFWEIAWIDFYR